MTPAMVSGIAQTLPQASSTAISNASRQLQNEAALKENNAPAKANNPAAADSISISPQARQAIANGDKEKPSNNSVKKDNPAQENSTDVTAATSKVQFEYDLKGELVTKYMDSSERVIYQVPSELKQRLAEFLSKPESSLNTKV